MVCTKKKSSFQSDPIERRGPLLSHFLLFFLFLLSFLSGGCIARAEVLFFFLFFKPVGFYPSRRMAWPCMGWNVLGVVWQRDWGLGDEEHVSKAKFADSPAFPTSSPCGGGGQGRCCVVVNENLRANLRAPFVFPFLALAPQAIFSFFFFFGWTSSLVHYSLCQL